MLNTIIIFIKGTAHQTSLKAGDDRGVMQDVIVDAKSNAIPIASKKRFEVFLLVVGFVHLVRTQKYPIFSSPFLYVF